MEPLGSTEGTRATEQGRLGSGGGAQKYRKEGRSALIMMEVRWELRWRILSRKMT